MELFSFVSGIGIIQAICLIIGLGLVIFEMFDPGFGVPGLTGLVLLAAGVIITAKTLFEALVMIIILIAILALALMLALRSATRGHLSKTLILNDALNTASGFVSSDNLISFLDKEGIALTTLRPSGTGLFENTRLDVVTEGDYIPKNSKIKIIEISGSRIVVKEIV